MNILCIECDFIKRVDELTKKFDNGKSSNSMYLEGLTNICLKYWLVRAKEQEE